MDVLCAMERLVQHFEPSSSIGNISTVCKKVRVGILEKKWSSCILIKISITTALRCPLRDISQYLEIGRTSPPRIKAKHHIILKLYQSSMKHIFISYSPRFDFSVRKCVIYLKLRIKVQQSPMILMRKVTKGQYVAEYGDQA